MVAFDKVTHSFPVEASEVPFERFQPVRDENGKVADLAPFPTMMNYGPGPAIHIEVSFEGRYSNGRKTKAFPFQAMPGQRSQVVSIPDWVNDIAKPIDTTSGEAVISYRDLLGKPWETRQEYNVSYSDGEVLLEFGEITNLPLDYSVLTAGL